MKVYFFHMRSLILVLACILGIGLWYFTTKPVFAQTATTALEIPIHSVNRPNKVASLTFDTAWGNEDTQKLMDILAKYEVKATFFVVGEWARKYPESILALHEAGHEIMNHSDKHTHMPQLTTQQIIDDINRCNDEIEAITGTRPKLFRPPYGDYDNKLVLTLRDMGMYSIQWDVDSLDWNDPTPAELQKRIVKQVKEGSIVLFHNAAKNTPAALPGIIEALQKNGFEFVPVGKLIFTGESTVDQSGRQMQATGASSNLSPALRSVSSAGFELEG